MCAYRTCRRYYNMTKSFIFVLYVPNDCLIYDIKCGAAMSLMGNSMREYHVTKILFLMVSSCFFNILLSTSCALKKREKFIYRLPIHVVTFSQSGRYFFWSGPFIYICSLYMCPYHNT